MKPSIFMIGLTFASLATAAAEAEPEVPGWMSLRVDFEVEKMAVKEAISSLHEKAIDLGVVEMGLRDLIFQEPVVLDQHTISVSLRQVSLFEAFEILATAGGSSLLVHGESLIVRSPHVFVSASFPLNAMVSQALRIELDGVDRMDAIMVGMASFGINYERIFLTGGGREKDGGERAPERFVVTSTEREIEIIRSIIFLSERGIEVKPKVEFE